MTVIESAPGGQKTTVPKTYAIPLSDGSTQDYWAKLLDLYTALGIPRAGQMLNGKISPAVSGSDLVLSLKTEAGATPSADDPIYINIAGAVRKVTAATTCTLAAATNWMNLGAAEFATLEQDLFACAVWDSADSVVAVTASRIPVGRVVSNFNSTNTNERHLVNYANFTTTDSVVNIGRFAATLSAGAGYTWSVPAYTNENLIQEPTYNTRDLSWTPGWTGLTTTSATITAKYMIDRYSLEYHVEAIWGASTAISGTVSHTLPFSKGSGYGGTSAGHFFGTLRLQDTGVAGYLGSVSIESVATWRVINASGTYGTLTALSSTVPFTWATNDEMLEWVRYMI